MESEQILTLIFIVLGAVSGFLSNYSLSTFSYLAFVIPFAIFFVSFFSLIKIFPIKKFKKGLIEHFITFLLVWLVVWTFFNTGGIVVG